MRRALALLALMPAFAGLARAAAPADSLAPGIVRVHADARARDAMRPSVALERPWPALGPAAEPLRTPVAFERRPGGIVARLALEPGTTLYGAGEAAGPLARNGRTIVTWNTDAYGWRDTLPSLYQSHPWVLALRPDGSAFGALADVPERVMIDLTRGIEFRAAVPSLPVIVIEGASPAEVLARLADLTGHPPLPPRWALGFQQCRFSYTPESVLREVADTFRAKRIPCDVLWLDIDYMDRFRSFTFDPAGFPAPESLMSALHGQGFRTVAILDPGIRVDGDNAVWREGQEHDAWVKAADGTPFVGAVWPGECNFPDFTRRETRAWWARRVSAFLDRGVDGVWNDMNEPAVFHVPGGTMPETNHHDADAELGGPDLHRRYHNLYGTLMARASYEGARLAHPDRRPFVLTRAGFLGGQRWGATWTGDNRATWDHLRWSVPMTLNLGLSGQPFSGPDLGGFGGTCTPELYARWIGVGALFPFARAHSEKGTPRREPWSFGPAVEATARRAIEQRMRLVPYLYTAFEEAARTGMPVMRPVCFAAPRVPALRTESAAFLLGGDLLVEPQLDPVRSSVPGVHELLARETGPWLRVNLHGTAEALADPDLPEVRIRPGAIVPLGPVMQHTGERPLDVVTLLVSPDARGHAEGVLYEDAGDGDATAPGAHRRTRFVVDGAKERVEVVAGSFPEPAGRRYVFTRVAD